jgi:hypothetical protein
MEHVIVERQYAQAVDPDAVRAAGAAANGCHDALRVRWLRSTLSLDGKRMICEYEAPDAETVRRAQDRAGLPYERVWTARVILP